MKISILCSSEQHPVNKWLDLWVEKQSKFHSVELKRKKKELSGGDLLFLISCNELINSKERALYKYVLVIHASDLPVGRGWSPHVWQILEGKTQITVSLLEAEDKVDSGDIWHQLHILVPKHALYDELNELLFNAEVQLMDFAVSQFDSVVPYEQSVDIQPTYYPKRTPADSKLDPQQSIAAQFDALRVCDPIRFPAFFELHGHKYVITLEKINE